MRYILHLLAALALVFSNYATAAPCCCDEQDQQCDLIQCSQMGCMPAVMPVPLAGTQTMPVHLAGRDYAPEPLHRWPALHEEPWTPPD
jgi:hypothetical protein